MKQKLCKLRLTIEEMRLCNSIGSLPKLRVLFEHSCWAAFIHQISRKFRCLFVSKPEITKFCTVRLLMSPCVSGC